MFLNANRLCHELAQISIENWPSKPQAYKETVLDNLSEKNSEREKSSSNALASLSNEWMCHIGLLI